MAGETNLDKLLETMSPTLVPGRFVFVTVAEAPADVEVHATVREAEGLSVVIEQRDADRLGLTYDFVGAWITLQVHSALEAVGLTAAVSAALAAEGISCNVIAGRHHDHLLVPQASAVHAVDVLRDPAVQGRVHPA